MWFYRAPRKNDPEKSWNTYCHKLTSHNMAQSECFSSPSSPRGRHDLNGRLDNGVFKVFSNVQEGSQVYESNHHVEFLYAYGEHIAAVAHESPDTYVIVAGSDIFRITGVTVNYWAATIEDDVTRVYGIIDGLQYSILPFDSFDRESQTWRTLIDIPGAQAEWLYHNADDENAVNREDEPDYLDDGADNEMEALLQIEARY
jgi:hypothetical protein